MGILEEIRETVREKITGDDKFYQSLTYYFELKVPAEATISGVSDSFYFPLILNPESIEWDEEFEIELTSTVAGGLFAEENGVLKRRLRITGSQGFKPKPSHAKAFGNLKGAEHKSYGRVLPDGYWAEDLSGQAHFQFLQDKVFRTYADLKRDPATSEGTELHWHNPKDSEHWRIIPEVFSGHRDKNSRVTYPYTITAYAVAPSVDPDKNYDDDGSFLDTIKDVIRTVRKASELLRSCVATVTKFIGEIDAVLATVKGVVSSLADVMREVGDLITAVDRFLGNTVTYVKKLPVEIENAANNLANIMASLFTKDQDAALAAAAASLAPPKPIVPDSIMQALRTGEDGLNSLGQHPEIFEPSISETLRLLEERRNVGGALTATEVSAAVSSSSTLNGVANLGTEPLPGDAILASTDFRTPIPNWQSVREHVLTDTDTLHNLASRFLGSSRYWFHIALINNLRPPFITECAMTGTLKMGDRILIPSFAKQLNDHPGFGVLGVKQSASLQDRQLGTDYELAPVKDARGLYDLQIDTDTTDASELLQINLDTRTVSGVQNLKQALIVRSEVAQGTDPQHPGLGYPRLSNLGINAVDIEITKLKYAKSLRQDPRITTINRIAIGVGATPDVIEASITAEVRGFDHPLKTTVGI